MNLRDTIVTSISHIVQDKLRAGLSILGVFIGVASVLCMIAIGDGAKQIIADDIKKLGGPNQVRLSTIFATWRKNRIVRHTTERYTLEDAKAIQAEVPDVLYVLPQTTHTRHFVSSRNSRQTQALLKGITSDHALAMHWEVHDGRFISEEDVEAAKQVCILGANTAFELFGEANPIGEEVKLRNHWQRPSLRLRVIGIMKIKGNSLSTWFSLDDLICVPLTTHQKRFSGTFYVENIDIFFQKDTDFDRLMNAVKNVLRKRHRGKDDFIGYWRPTVNLRRLEHIEKVIKIALGSIAGFSLFVSGIGIMNICLVSVGEKTREIGLRKSIGAKPTDIFCQFLIESICLCLCGTLLGGVGGWVAAHGMSRLAILIFPIVPEWPVLLSLPWMLISVIFSIFMGVGFGVYPAIRAARLSPIDALRAEK